MEILFITHKYPPAIGGMEQQSFHLINGIQTYCQVRTIIYNAKKGNRLRFFLSLKNRIKQALQLYPNIQAIHLNDGLIASYFLLFLPDYKLPVTVTFHGLDVVFPLPFFQKKIVPLFSRVSRAFAVSHSTASALKKRGVPSEKIQVIKNGVDRKLPPNIPSLFKRKLEHKLGVSLQHKKVLIMMGRPVKRKGFSWFLEKVLVYLPEDVICIMIGPISKQKWWIKKMAHLLPKSWWKYIELFFGLASDEDKILEIKDSELIKNKFHHLGPQSRDHVYHFLGIADLFIMPNLEVDGDMEGFGLVALEAALCGTPVVASAIDGITDAVIDNENGFLLPSGDQEEWVFKLFDLLYGDYDLSALGEKAAAYTRAHYSWDKMCNEYYTQFCDLIQDNPIYAEDKLKGIVFKPSLKLPNAHES